MAPDGLAVNVPLDVPVTCRHSTAPGTQRAQSVLPVTREQPQDPLGLGCTMGASAMLWPEAVS